MANTNVPQDNMPTLVPGSMKTAKGPLPPTTVNDKGQLFNEHGHLVNEKGHLLRYDGSRIRIRGSRGRGDRRNSNIKRANRERFGTAEAEEVQTQERQLQDEQERMGIGDVEETKKRQREASKEADTTHRKRIRREEEDSSARFEYGNTTKTQEGATQASEGKEERKEVKIKGMANNQKVNISKTSSDSQLRKGSDWKGGNGKGSADWGHDGSQDKTFRDISSSWSGQRHSYDDGYNSLTRDRQSSVGHHYHSTSVPPVSREPRGQEYSAKNSSKPSLSTRQYRRSIQRYESWRSHAAQTGEFPAPSEEEPADDGFDIDIYADLEPVKERITEDVEPETAIDDLDIDVYADL